MKNLSSVLPSTLNLLPVESLSEFTSRIEREFLTGSAIAISLYTDNIRIVSDIEITDGGDVSCTVTFYLSLCQINVIEGVKTELSLRSA